MMDKDDHISKLFRSKAEDYEVKPSKDLWSQIESNLDVVDTPTRQIRGRRNARHGRMVSMTRWFVVAASVAVLAIASVGVLQLSENETSDLAEIKAVEAQKSVTKTVENLPIAALTEEEQEANFAAADAAQAERILRAATEQEVKDEKEVEVTLVDRATTTELMDDFILVELEEENTPAVVEGNTDDAVEEPTANIITPTPPAPKSAPVVKGEPELRYEEGNVTATDLMNYSNSVNSYTYADDLSNSSGATYPSMDEPVSQEAEMPATPQRYTNTIQRGANKRNRKQNTETANTIRLKGSMEIFDWLIGSWSDDNQQTGTSIEEWKIQDANTLVGKGYVLLGDAKIFQEEMEIAYKRKLRQIFLTLALDDSGSRVEYMLSGYDITSGEYIFQQRENFDYPDKILLQRDISGTSYNVIIVDGDNKRNSLDTEQQRYLDHRNHVSGARATRRMTKQ